MRESTSRPSWSVPNRWRPDGGSRMRLMSGRLGSHGEMAGASTASSARHGHDHAADHRQPIPR